MRLIIVAIVAAALILGAAMIFLMGNEKTPNVQGGETSIPVEETPESTTPESAEPEEVAEAAEAASGMGDNSEAMAQSSSESSQPELPTDVDVAQQMIGEGYGLYYNAASGTDFRRAEALFEAAVTGLDAMIEGNGSDPQLYYVRSLAQYELGEMHTLEIPDWQVQQDERAAHRYLESAWESAESAVKLDADFSEGHRMIGQAVNRLIPFKGTGFAMTNGGVPQDRATRALDLDPSNVFAYLVRGQAYLFTPQAFGGNPTKAVEAFREALSISKINHEQFLSNVWLGWASITIGEIESGRAALEAALEIYPNSQWAQSMLDDL
jgi:tetratricopeptide (TPR) repeat protein